MVEIHQLTLNELSLHTIFQGGREGGGLTQKLSKPQQEYKGMISEAPPLSLTPLQNESETRLPTLALFQKKKSVGRPCSVFKTPEIAGNNGCYQLPHTVT